MALYDSRGYEIGNVLDRRAYPTARRNRMGPPPSGSAGSASFGAESLGPPRMRLFSFVFGETASSRRTMSGNLCNGPALIKDIVLGTNTNTDPPNKSLEIGFAATRVTEAGVALTTPRPYTLLVELINPFGTLAAAVGGGLVQHTVEPFLHNKIIPLDLVVLDAQFYPVAAWVNNSLNAQTAHGWMRVLEQIPLSKVGDYMS